MADYQSRHTGAEIDAAVDNIKNVNLSAAGFTPVANTYYKHTGTTTTTFTQGVIYYYDGTNYKAINGNGEGGGSQLYSHIVTVEGSDDSYTVRAIFNITLSTDVEFDFNSLLDYLKDNGFRGFNSGYYPISGSAFISGMTSSVLYNAYVHPMMSSAIYFEEADGYGGHALYSATVIDKVIAI